MRILGIDPGLNATGYGVIETAAAGSAVIAAGVIRPNPKQPLAQRILALYDALAQVVEASHPDLTVLEACFTHHAYLSTAAMMAHARSVALLLSAQRSLTVAEYPPARVKKALTGNGAASKAQVARAVGLWLGLSSLPWSADTTDALALAVTHAHMGRVHQDGVVRPARGTGRRPAMPPALAQAIAAQGLAR